MSRTFHHDKYKIEGQRKAKPDTRRLARALAKWVQAQREQEAQNAEPQPPKGSRPKEQS